MSLSVFVIILISILGGLGWGVACGLWFARRDLHNETRSLREQVALSLTVKAGNVETINRDKRGQL